MVGVELDVGIVWLMMLRLMLLLLFDLDVVVDVFLMSSFLDFVVLLQVYHC